MSLNQSAEENLRIIRSLMERTATYRAVSVPAAAWAGCLSIAALVINITMVSFNHSFTSRDFLSLWLGVLVLAGIGNALLLYRDAHKTGTSFPSPALLSALQGMVPAFFVAGAWTGVLIFWELRLGDEGLYALVAVPIWMLFYGLGLLGTQHFAPRSIVIMGWAFLICAVILFVTGPSLLSVIAKTTTCDPLLWFPSALMAATFGGFHLIYAVAVHFSIRRDRALSAN